MNSAHIARRAAMALALVVLGLGSGRASAAVRLFEAHLTGTQETPSNPSPATGLGEIQLNDVTGDVTVLSGTYISMLGASGSVNIQGPAAPGATAPVLISLTQDFPGNINGSFSGSGILSPSNVGDMINGLTYINLSSSLFPTGEIRGQLLEVPEPATIGLGILVVGISLLRRRNRDVWSNV